MKVIDLLNKIANGEYPTIKDGINKYEYDKDENDYITGMGYNYEHYFSNINILDYLNDEVEIIEEDKKIYKLDWVEGNTFSKIQENSYLSRKEIQLLDSNFKELGNKINEIIDKLNEGEDNE